MSEEDKSAEILAKEFIKALQGLQYIGIGVTCVAAVAAAVFLGIFIWEWALQHLTKVAIIAVFVSLITIKAAREWDRK